MRENPRSFHSSDRRTGFSRPKSKTENRNQRSNFGNTFQRALESPDTALQAKKAAEASQRGLEKPWHLYLIVGSFQPAYRKTYPTKGIAQTKMAEFPAKPGDTLVISQDRVTKDNMGRALENQDNRRVMPATLTEAEIKPSTPKVKSGTQSSRIGSPIRSFSSLVG